MNYIQYRFLGLFILATYSSISLSFAQEAENTPFDRKHIEDKDDLKMAENALDLGYIFYEEPYSINYDSALHYFMKAQEVNPHNADLNLRIGYCHLWLSQGPNTKVAREYFAQALKLDKALEPFVLYYTGQAHHLQSEWRKAANYYVQYENTLDPEEDVKAIAAVGERLRQCRTGEELSKNPIKADIENLGTWVNSIYREHSPIISANASVLYFTGRLPNTVGGERDMDGLYFEDVYISYAREGKGWSKPRNLGRPINTDGHDATVSLSPDGTKMVIMREGDLYYSNIKGNDWTEAQPFPDVINSRRSFETAASYADDGKTLYFISDRKEAIGEKDIFVSYQQENGEWSEAQNLGEVINTPKNENGVFMHPDGSTLYFSSDGHNTIGGTDIFKSVKTDDGWSEPINMGIPLNTPFDDQCIVVTADYQYGYYSTKGRGSVGDHDLFRISFLDAPEPLQMLSPKTKESRSSLEARAITIAGGSPQTLVAGSVLDHESRKPLVANVSIVRLSDGKVVKSTQTDEEGAFLVSLPSREDYRITFRKKGYLYYAHTEKALGEDGRDFIDIAAPIKEIIPDQTLVLKDVFFKRASASLKPDSYSELNSLAETLLENPDLVIEIGGHTDSLGDKDRLMKLSRLRMEAVRSYLINKGISGKRLEGKAYGGTKPLNNNETPEEQARNRRVEFKVLKVK